MILALGLWAWAFRLGPWSVLVLLSLIIKQFSGFVDHLLFKTRAQQFGFYTFALQNTFSTSDYILEMQKDEVRLFLAFTFLRY